MTSFVKLLGFLVAARVASATSGSSRASGDRFIRRVEVGGKMLMQLTARWHSPVRTAPKAPFVVYGVMTTDLPPNREKLAAQVETWAKGLAEQGRFFSVAGASARGIPSAGLIAEERCPDTYDGVPCKEGRILEEAFNRGAAWLVVLGEDNYVNTTRMEDFLRESAPTTAAPTPTAFGIVGCGKGFGYCAEVDAEGGLCGGGGYAINRPALEAVMRDGSKALRRQFADRYEPGDMASSCALRRRGVRLRAMPGLLGNRIEKAAEFKSALSGNPTTLHYCTPEVTRWVHAYLTQQPADEVSALEAKAFEGGCCCSPHADHGECEEPPPGSASAIQMGPVDLALLAEAYVDERNSQLRKGRRPRAG